MRPGHDVLLSHLRRCHDVLLSSLRLCHDILLCRLCLGHHVLLCSLWAKLLGQLRLCHDVLRSRLRLAHNVRLSSLRLGHHVRLRYLRGELLRCHHVLTLRLLHGLHILNLWLGILDLRLGLLGQHVLWLLWLGLSLHILDTSRWLKILGRLLGLLLDKLVLLAISGN